MNSEIFETLINGLGDKDNRKNNLDSFISKLLSRNIDPEQVSALVLIANKNTKDSLPLKEVGRIMNLAITKEVERREKFEEINNTLHEIGLDINQLN